MAEPKKMELPKHRYEMELHVGANTMEQLGDRLSEIADDVYGHNAPPSRVSGGGYRFTVKTNEDVTEESYKEYLQKWSANKKLINKAQREKMAAWQDQQGHKEAKTDG